MPNHRTRSRIFALLAILAAWMLPSSVSAQDAPKPPDRRVTLTAEQIATKRAAIGEHQAGTSPVHDHLADEYMKPEELFWKIRVEPAAAK